jgi:ABC-type branched-subunit amino acid transport system substrate-binding protein
MKKFTFISLLLLVSMIATACGPKAAPFECTDAIGCVTIAPGDPVRIGYALVLSGPNESLGIDSRNGIEIAIGDHDRTNRWA